MMLTALLPSVLAASLITGRELGFYVVTSVVVSLAVVLVGLLQDFSGLSEEVPVWVRDSVLIVFTPSLVALVALMVLQNSVRVQGVLAAVTASRSELAEQADELRRSRARVVAATDRERRRIERDLHDGAQQRLIGIGIGLSRAKELCFVDGAAAAVMLDSLRHELRVAHDELRNLAQGVYPPVLTEHGLTAALQSAADRCPLTVTVELDQVGRHHPDVEAALYFCCVEAMQNGVGHAQARSIKLGCGADASMLWISVTDDGIGFDVATSSGGRGIDNIRDRLGAIGGELEVITEHDAGVTCGVRSDQRHEEPLTCRVPPVGEAVAHDPGSPGSGVACAGRQLGTAQRTARRRRRDDAPDWLGPGLLRRDLPRRSRERPPRRPATVRWLRVTAVERDKRLRRLRARGDRPDHLMPRNLQRPPTTTTTTAPRIVQLQPETTTTTTTTQELSASTGNDDRHRSDDRFADWLEHATDSASPAVDYR